MRFMLDSHIFDAIVAEPAFIERLNSLTANGTITLLTTPIQERELVAIPDQVKKSRIAEVKREVVKTAGGIWGIGQKWGEGIWGDGTEQLRISEIRSKGTTTRTNSARDAVIAATAARDADVLVTDETEFPFKSRMAKGKTNCQVWTFYEFKTYLARLAG